jgi:hypothetical protein
MSFALFMLVELVACGGVGWLVSWAMSREGYIREG